MKKISKQELKQIIREEIEKENLVEFDLSQMKLPSIEDFFSKTGESAGEAIPEKAKGFLVGLVLELFGINARSPLALIFRKSIANIDFEEWAGIMSDKGGQRCQIIADNVYEGIVEGGAVAIMNALVGDPDKPLEVSVSGTMFGVGEEMVTNWLKDTEVATTIKTKLSTAICQGIEKVSITDLF
jgi:hypothetical protein